MSRYKIIDLYKEFQNPPNIERMFGETFTQSYMQPYLNDDDYLFDEYFTKRYASFEWENNLHQSGITKYVFQFDFNSFLLINDSKLKELFRMESIDDTKYSLYNNYDMTEHTESSASVNTGSRIDIQSVSPYDTTSFANASKNELGAQDSTSGGESTLTRVGNIGVMTVSDMLERHDSLFSKYLPFYVKLFDMFAKEYLYVGEEYDD